MTTFTWSPNTLSAAWTDPSEWTSQGRPVDVYPYLGDSAVIGAGTVTLGFGLADIAVTLAQPVTGVTLAATGVDLGDRTRLLTAAGAPGQVAPIVFDVIGTGTLDDTGLAVGMAAQPGAIDFTAAPLTIELSANPAGTSTTASFLDSGAIGGGDLVLAAGTGAAAPSAATFTNNSTIDVTGVLHEMAGVTLSGTGEIVLHGLGASAEFGGPVGAGQTIASAGMPTTAALGGTLTIDNLALFQGTIELDAHNEVAIKGMAASVQGYAGGVLSFSNGATLHVLAAPDAANITSYAAPAEYGGQGATYVLATAAAVGTGGGSGAGGSGSVGSGSASGGTGGGGTASPCFCSDTRLASEMGEVAVEQVRAGDRLRLARGGLARVMWVGHREVSCDRHPRPHDVWPVRVRAGAVAPGVPARDLLLSPDHAILVAGDLIPVRHLINGASIVQEPHASARYHHIELERHDLLLAEGLAAESYLDTGNRAAFAAGGPALDLHPDFARRIWAQAGCAPLVEGGAALARARRALLRRAVLLGHRRTADPAPRLLADGRALPAETDGAIWQVRLPEGVREVRLCSRVWVPAHMHADEQDTRVLGVALGRLWRDGREAALDSPALVRGWHAPEPMGRWTDGEGVLLLTGVRTLSFALAMVGNYWRGAEGRRRPRIRATA